LAEVRGTIGSMAKKRIVTITDDIDGRSAAETVSFAYAGRNYEIDLGEKNRAKLEKALEPFISAARKPAAGGKASVTTVLDLNAVRSWAAEQGLEVAARGRVAKKVIEGFLQSR
jgi:hypothetical protein